MNTTATINPDRLAQLEAGEIKLDRNSHGSFEDGHCAMEVVAWLAELGHTDAPSCSSGVLRTYTISLNDRWNNEQRQKLAPYLPRMVGTAGDDQDEARSYLALDWIIRTFTPTWLDLAGLTDNATALRGLDPITNLDTARAAAEHVYAAQTAARDAAWAAARDALAPTVETLQASALDLLDRMIDPSKAAA